MDPRNRPLVIRSGMLNAVCICPRHLKRGWRWQSVGPVSVRVAPGFLMGSYGFRALKSDRVYSASFATGAGAWAGLQTT